ncbi:MAG: cysteine synthase family protein [Vicinamibacterales bacterium]
MDDILACIGGTPLVPLRSVAPATGARVLVKLESQNPTGNLKDRMALAMVSRRPPQRPAGRGRAGGRNAGDAAPGSHWRSSAQVLGHPLHVVSSDAFAREKLDHMRLLGATLRIVASDGGRMTADLTRAMIEAARVVAESSGAYWTDQMRNRDQLAGYHRLGDEILAETGGRLDAFVQSVGTGGAVRGVAEVVRARRPAAAIVAVEPAESAVLSGGAPGAHAIDGIGAGFVVPLWDARLVDAIETVSTTEAIAMAVRLASEEGLFAGTSTGANVVAALRVAAGLPPTATVVTIMCDTGISATADVRRALTGAAGRSGGGSACRPPPPVPWPSSSCWRRRLPAPSRTSAHRRRPHQAPP